VRATQTLPDEYAPVGTLDLRDNLRAMLVLNGLGLVLLVVSGWLFVRIGLWLRPEAAGQLSFEVNTPGSILGVIFGLIGLTVVMLVVHEAIHGVFFWLFTGSRPHFGIGAGYAYATAPGWYIPRGQYFVVSLAPLVLISVAGMGLAALAPVSWFVPVLALVIMNASGAVGDMAVAAWLLAQPPTCLAQDKGDAVTLYRQQS